MCCLVRSLCHGITQVTGTAYGQRRQGWSLQELTHMDKGGAPEALTWAETSHLGPLVPGK